MAQGFRGDIRILVRVLVALRTRYGLKFLTQFHVKRFINVCSKCSFFMRMYCSRPNCPFASTVRLSPTVWPTVNRDSALHEAVLRIFNDAVLTPSGYVASNEMGSLL